MSGETETKEQKKPIIEASTTKPCAATHSENTAKNKTMRSKSKKLFCASAYMVTGHK